ncbi:MAG: type II toxin-antitoxin system prevent-host-death family antitoxin [Magnetococcales bacterium]|nr:type II toxin-antitoxin system prevent-host-death family antitoxin [Magnetococcales bacterium]
MPIVTPHEASTHLAPLIDQTADGEMVRAQDKSVARLVPLSSNDQQARTLGLGQGRFTLPENFYHLYDAEIQRMFTAME